MPRPARLPGVTPPGSCREGDEPMKRFIWALAAAGALVPAALGLLGNHSLAQSVPVPVPSRAELVTSTPSPAPSEHRTASPSATADDHGGATAAATTPPAMTTAAPLPAATTPPAMTTADSAPAQRHRLRTTAAPAARATVARTTAGRVTTDSHRRHRTGRRHRIRRGGAEPAARRSSRSRLATNCASPSGKHRACAGSSSRSR